MTAWLVTDTRPSFGPLRRPHPTTCSRRQPLRASNDPPPASSATLSPAATAVVALAAPSLPIVAWSEWTLATTGCGLPPGPGGALGAAEGIGYLVVAGVVAWSVATKVRTGKGLPAGPAGVLGVVEGLAYMLAVCGVVAGAVEYAEFGELPNAVPGPGSRCFPE